MSESMVAAHRMAWATYIRARAIASWKTITNRTVRKVFILLTLLVRVAEAWCTSSTQAEYKEEEGSRSNGNDDATNDVLTSG
jgi:hypothetical protein